MIVSTLTVIKIQYKTGKNYLAQNTGLGWLVIGFGSGYWCISAFDLTKDTRIEFDKSDLKLTQLAGCVSCV